MSDWLHNLPVPLMALAIFAFTYLLAIAIFAAVTVLATGERAKSFKAISPGMLPVLGIIFGLFVAFTAAQVWNDNDRAGLHRRKAKERWNFRIVRKKCAASLMHVQCNQSSMLISI